MTRLLAVALLCCVSMPVMAATAAPTECTPAIKAEINAKADSALADLKAKAEKDTAAIEAKRTDALTKATCVPPVPPPKPSN